METTYLQDKCQRDVWFRILLFYGYCAHAEFNDLPVGEEGRTIKKSLHIVTITVDVL